MFFFKFSKNNEFDRYGDVDYGDDNDDEDDKRMKSSDISASRQLGRLGSGSTRA